MVVSRFEPRPPVCQVSDLSIVLCPSGKLDLIFLIRSDVWSSLDSLWPFVQQTLKNILLKQELDKIIHKKMKLKMAEHQLHKNCRWEGYGDTNVLSEIEIKLKTAVPC